MKFTKYIIALLCSLALVAYSRPPGVTDYATGGTFFSALATNYAVITVNSFNGSAPRVTFLAWTSEKAGSVIQFYNITNQAYCINTNFPTTAGTTNYISSTNGFVAGHFMLTEHLNSDTYELNIISSVTTTNIIIAACAPTNSTAIGDIIYECVPAGSIPVGATSSTLVGPGIYSGQPGKPLLAVLIGTNTVTINAINATFR